MDPPGSYPVGVADLSAVGLAPGVERLAARLFYPCTRSWALPCTWIPHLNYARGYVGYLFKLVTNKTWKTELMRAALTSTAWALGSSRVLPVYHNASAVPPPPPSGSRGTRLLPLIIFSHGLAGTRNAYSSICIELASQGYVVMALEHGDGSASVARLPRLPPGAAGRKEAEAAAAAIGGSTIASAAVGALADANPAVPSSSAAAAGVAPQRGGDAGAATATATSAGSDVTAGGSSSTPNNFTSTSSGCDTNKNQCGEEGTFSDFREGSATDGNRHNGNMDVNGNGHSNGTNGNSSGGGRGAGQPPHRSEWCFYGGLGDKAEQLRKTRHRVAEVEAALGLLRRLNEGRLLDGGNVWELPAAVASSLRGRLDVRRAAVVGHSYGGATAAAAASRLPGVLAAVSLDPWWDCFEEQWPVVTRWVNPHQPPLLVVGSDDWNTATSEGKLKCGGANRERVLAAAAAGGGGAVLVVPRGSTHANFDDVLLLFGKSFNALLRLLNVRSSLEPRRAHRINMWCILHFLRTHLPPPSQPSAPVGAAGAATTATAGEAGPDPPAHTPTARPVRQGDLEPYKEMLGEWAAELRLVEGAS